MEMFGWTCLIVTGTSFLTIATMVIGDCIGTMIYDYVHRISWDNEDNDE